MADKYYIKWEEFLNDTMTLIDNIKKATNSKTFKGMVVITRGGLAPAAVLANHYPIRLIETFGVESYKDGQQTALKSITIPQESIKDLGEGWLIIDELVDTGSTVAYARQLLPHAYIASVYTKQHGTALVDCSAREFSNDTWLVFPWEFNDGQD